MLQNQPKLRERCRSVGLAAFAALAMTLFAMPAQAQNHSDLDTWPVKGRLVNGDGSAVEGTQDRRLPRSGATPSAT